MGGAAVTQSGAGHVLVCGDVINDIVVKPLEKVTPDSDTRSLIRRCGGGSAANQAAWLASLGVPVRFFARVGVTDLEWHRDELARWGVDAQLTGDTDSPTGSIVVLAADDGTRTMYTDRGANLRLRREDIPSWNFDGANLLHLTGYSFMETGVRDVGCALVGEARERGMPFTVDPSSASFLASLPDGAFVAWTRGAAVCFPNRDEARVLTGFDEPRDAARALLAHYGTAVVTCGSEGVFVATPGDEVTHVAAVSSAVVDSTGAGDAFCAAFLACWRATGNPLAAARAAVQVAEAAVTRLGARPLESGHRPH
jgi:sugar/nucleoside kinase (ribokinase family)